LYYPTRVSTSSTLSSPFSRNENTSHIVINFELVNLCLIFIEGGGGNCAKERENGAEMNTSYGNAVTNFVANLFVCILFQNELSILLKVLIKRKCTDHAINRNKQTCEYDRVITRDPTYFL